MLSARMMETPSPPPGLLLRVQQAAACSTCPPSCRGYRHRANRRCRNRRAAATIAGTSRSSGRAAISARGSMTVLGGAAVERDDLQNDLLPLVVPQGPLLKSEFQQFPGTSRRGPAGRLHAPRDQPVQQRLVAPSARRRSGLDNRCSASTTGATRSAQNSGRPDRQGLGSTSPVTRINRSTRPNTGHTGQPWRKASQKPSATSPAFASVFPSTIVASRSAARSRSCCTC